VTLAWQESLFDDHPGGDGGLSFSGVRRRALDERCWLDLARAGCRGTALG
jgi:hypothetical protein